MNQLMTVAGQMTVEVVKEFVEHAKSNGVDISQEIVDSFLAGMKVPAPKGKGSRGPSRNPVSSFLLYRREKKEDIERALYDQDERTQVLANFSHNEEHADKVAALEAYGEECDAVDGGEDPPAPGAQNMVRMASLMWNLESEATRDSYKARAREQNAEFQRSNPGAEKATPPTGKAPRRSPAKAQSLENFNNVDYVRYETDPDFDGEGCGAWLNRGHKYCTRRKKADSGEPMCKGHMKTYEEALEQFPRDIPAYDAETNGDESEIESDDE